MWNKKEGEEALHCDENDNSLKLHANYGSDQTDNDKNY
jgi:hypothetical protein